MVGHHQPGAAVHRGRLSSQSGLSLVIPPRQPLERRFHLHSTRTDASPDVTGTKNGRWRLERLFCHHFIDVSGDLALWQDNLSCLSGKPTRTLYEN